MADDALRVGYTPSFLPVSFDYTSRDYYAIRDHLIQVVKARVPEWTSEDPSDFGLALVEAMSYMGDLMSYYIDRAGNEAFLPTATRRQSVINIAQTLGYSPARAVAAVGEVTFSSEPTYTGSAITVPEGTVVTAQIRAEDGTLNTVKFTTDAEITVANSGGQTTVDVVEGEWVSQTVNSSNGVANFEIALAQSPVASDNFAVYVNDGLTNNEWAEVTNLVEYASTDNVYETRLMGDGTVRVVFGDGITGRIPPTSQTITVQYRVGGGVRGNIPAGTITNIVNTGIDANLNVTNAASTYGGADEESTYSIRENAAIPFRANRRAVSKQDIEALARNVSGCYAASANAAVWSNITLAIAPNYDRSLNPGINVYEDCDYAWSSNTMTVTKTAHGLAVGQTVSLNFTTGGATSYDSTYAVATKTDNTFTVALTGSGASGKVTVSVDISTFVTLKNSVKTALEPLMMMGSSLTLRSPEYPKVVLGISVSLIDTIRQSDAESNIKAILMDGPFSFEQRGFGGAVTMGDVVTSVINNTGYINNVTVDKLYRKDSVYTSGVHDTEAAWYEILSLDVDTDLTINFGGTGVGS